MKGATMNDGLKKHRVYVELAVEIDIYDNWEAGDAAHLLQSVLENWWVTQKGTNDTMVVWQRDGFIVKEGKS